MKTKTCVQWMVNTCTEAGNLGFGNEWDWADFFRDVSTVSSSQASLSADILRYYAFACSGLPGGKCDPSSPASQVDFAALANAATTLNGGAGATITTYFKARGNIYGINF